MTENSEILGKILALGIRVGKINAMNPFSSYWGLNKLSHDIKEIGNEIEKTHGNYQKQDDSVGGYGLHPVIMSTEKSSKKIAEIIRIERSYQNVSSAIDKKQSYVFGFISLYIALISLSISVYSVLYSEQSRVSLFTFEILSK